MNGFGFGLDGIGYFYFCSDDVICPSIMIWWTADASIPNQLILIILFYAAILKLIIFLLI